MRGELEYKEEELVTAEVQKNQLFGAWVCSFKSCILFVSV